MTPNTHLKDPLIFWTKTHVDPHTWWNGYLVTDIDQTITLFLIQPTEDGRFTLTGAFVPDQDERADIYYDNIAEAGQRADQYIRDWGDTFLKDHTMRSENEVHEGRKARETMAKIPGDLRKYFEAHFSQGKFSGIVCKSCNSWVKLDDSGLPSGHDTDCPVAELQTLIPLP